ncbi:glycerophosphoryl diester phosphodiesterase membrane domain-containing protein [Streptomyces polychromogenes]|uniref:Glycerophosphoryl diester phosphodiesterase membrane domain-containing protein n=1 Tax=Streptomyces polychromogenes TaxID=67342 RepID=A0ABN0V8Z2_9ACTN
MNDSPGWAAPGSPSDGQGPDAAQQPPADGSAPSKWSTEQPPPGQWSSPTAGQTPPQQRPGASWGAYPNPPGQQPAAPYAYGNPGGGWGGPPPAAKPGIIPLRPLGLGEILDGAVGTLTGHWRSVLSISLVVAALSQIALLVVQRLTMDSLPLPSTEPATPREAIRALGDTGLLYGFQYYVEVLGLILVTSLLAPVFSRAVLGRPSTLGDTLKAVRPLAPRMLALTGLLLLGALAAGLLPTLPGFLLGSPALAALGLPVGIVLLAWFYVTFALAPPALMLERGTPAAALKRSAKLVKGSWWRIFGISMLTWVMRFILSGIIVLPFAAAAMIFGGGLTAVLDGSAGLSWPFLIITGIGAVAGATVTIPMQTGVTTLLYIDQRIRREALDLELARAAGVEGYGTTGTTTPTGG